MRLAWLSDIHLNFLTRDVLASFVSTLARSDSDAFLITGDIAEAPNLVPHLTILDLSLDRPIYFVLGNHDYYRSNFAAVRDNIKRLVQQSDNLIYLTQAEAISLAPATALVGHDGWADGRLGDFHRSMVLMNDFELIEDFTPSKTLTSGPASTVKPDWLHTMWQLADEAVAHFERVIPAALSTSEHVVVATHVPPFREASLHGGGVSAEDFLPFFASRIVGDSLRQLMADHPHNRMTVYCGHTHGRGSVQILDNLVVESAGAEYGAPEIQKLITID